MSAKRKTRAQLEAELAAANKRCADLADALVKQIMSTPIHYGPLYPVQPIFVPTPFYAAPQPFSEPWVITTCSTTDKVQS